MLFMHMSINWFELNTPRTFQSHRDATWAAGHAARGLGLWGFSAQHSPDVAHTVTVDGVCGQAQAGRGVHLGDVHLAWKEQENRIQ